MHNTRRVAGSAIVEVKGLQARAQRDDGSPEFVGDPRLAQDEWCIKGGDGLQERCLPRRGVGCAILRVECAGKSAMDLDAGHEEQRFVHGGKRPGKDRPTGHIGAQDLGVDFLVHCVFRRRIEVTHLPGTLREDAARVHRPFPALLIAAAAEKVHS